MHLSTLIEMIDSAYPDRVLLGSRGSATSDHPGLTGSELADRSRRGASTFSGAQAIVYVGENHPYLPVLVLAAASAGKPFVPVNYRLEDDQLHRLIARWPKAMVVTDGPATAERLEPQRLDLAGESVPFDDWFRSLPDSSSRYMFDDEDAPAIALFTSGTTSEPKSALLRHRHLMSYLLGNVEFAGAEPTDAALVSVPPYHVAGVTNLLSNLYSGRRLVYLQRFDAHRWLSIVEEERITHAMVVPTMLSRVVEALKDSRPPSSTLRVLSYGGAKVAESVLLQALDAFPEVDFVNAYGLTETASTIAVLGPDDHRQALNSADPSLRRRLGSVGRAVPSVEVEIRSESGDRLDSEEIGIIYVRGSQVAGEYATGSVLDDQGWFCTRDHGWLDQDGYLFIEGRADDTIIRGGENIAPAEIEEVLLRHPDVIDACVVGIPDEEWGQRIEAVVVIRSDNHPDEGELRNLVKTNLRSSKTPDRIWRWDSLPHTETGKLLRRVVLSELTVAAKTD